MTGGSQALGNQPRKKARIEVEGEEDKTEDTEPRIIGGDVTRCGRQHICFCLPFSSLTVSSKQSNQGGGGFKGFRPTQFLEQ